MTKNIIVSIIFVVAPTCWKLKMYSTKCTTQITTLYTENLNYDGWAGPVGRETRRSLAQSLAHVFILEKIFVLFFYNINFSMHTLYKIV